MAIGFDTGSKYFDSYYEALYEIYECYYDNLPYIGTNYYEDYILDSGRALAKSTKGLYESDYYDSLYRDYDWSTTLAAYGSNCSNNILNTWGFGSTRSTSKSNNNQSGVTLGYNNTNSSSSNNTNSSSSNNTNSSSSNNIDSSSSFDEIVGSPNKDTLRGKNTAVHLKGMGGSDKIIGSKKDDILDGGNGNDVVIGKRGADTYVLSSGNDKFKGFKLNEGDTVEIDSDIAYTLVQSKKNTLIQHDNGVTTVLKVIKNELDSVIEIV